MKTRKRKRSGRRPWRPPKPLLALLGLAALGVAATVLSSRRIEPLEGWDDLLDDEPDPRLRSQFPSTPHWVDGPVGSLFVEDGGSGGLPVVFVHGLGGASGHWHGVLDALRAERRALALDLRGHGRSQPPAAAEYSIADYAADVVAVADDLGLDSFVLAGHSLGATVAIEVAARHPDRVAGVFLVDPSGDQTRIPRRDLDASLAAIAANPHGELHSQYRQLLVGAEPEVADRVLADLDSTPPEALVESLQSAFAFATADALGRYPGPRLALVSDFNSLPSSLHRLLPDLPVRLVSGASHWLMLDRPDAVAEALAELPDLSATGEGGIVAV
jgi:pimeloyl-ACP methyl ester carboxylesterase